MQKPRVLMTLLVVGAAACFDFGSLSSGTGASASDAGPEASTVDGADGEPADGGATDAGATDGDVSDGAAPDASGPVDAGPPWLLYSNLSSFPNTWNVIGLDVAWTGANAPPPRGIIAVTRLTEFDRLLVWTDEGKFYVREAGAWRPPQLTATAFPALAGRDFRGCYHQPDFPQPGIEELTFVENPTAILYTYSSNDAIAFESQVTLGDEPAPYGAPKATKKLRWVLRSWDDSKFGTAGYLAEYSAYENDDYVYFFDATATPTNKWLFADAPLFKGKSNVPPKTAIRAGWRDDPASANYLIVEP